MPALLLGGILGFPSRVSSDVPEFPDVKLQHL